MTRSRGNNMFCKKSCFYLLLLLAPTMINANHELLGHRRDNSSDKDDYFRLFKTMHRPAEHEDISHMATLSGHLADRNWNAAKNVMNTHLQNESHIRRTISWLGHLSTLKDDRNWRNRLMELTNGLITRLQARTATALHIQ